MVIVANESGAMLSSGVYPQRRSLSFYFKDLMIKLVGGVGGGGYWTDDDEGPGVGWGWVLGGRGLG